MIGTSTCDAQRLHWLVDCIIIIVLKAHTTGSVSKYELVDAQSSLAQANGRLPHRHRLNCIFAYHSINYCHHPHRTQIVFRYRTCYSTQHSLAIKSNEFTKSKQSKAKINQMKNYSQLLLPPFFGCVRKC